jgi:hypothetical protein
MKTQSDLNQRIVRLSNKMDGGNALGGLMADTGGASCEKEVMIAQTIEAARFSLEDCGEAFSYDESNKVRHGNGVVDNGLAYRYLISEGLLTKGKHRGRKTLIPTEKLVVMLEKFLKLKPL